jgi:glycogen phosphorylase
MTKAVRDPVCGMTVDPTTHRSVTFQGQAFFFCSDYCHDAFQASAELYAVEPTPPDEAQDPAARRIAYFSMEVGVDPRMPIYSGGLGILAGDTLRSCADLKVPVVGVSLLYTRVSGPDPRPAGEPAGAPRGVEA